MKSFVVVLAYAFIAFSAKSYAQSERWINTESLGTVINAKACKAKCGQSQQNCVAWGYTASHDRCTGWILNEADHSNNYYADFYDDDGPSYGGVPDYSGVLDYGGVIASPNITASSASNNTLEDCSLSRVDLGIHYSQFQQCVAACENLVHHIYRGCIAWLWSSEDHHCEGLLLRDVSSGYDKCGIP